MSIVKIKDFDLTEWLKFLPEEGKLLFGGDRMLLLRQDAMGRLWYLLHQHLGMELTNSIMTQFGFRCGFGDFKVLNQVLNIEDNEMKIATGPMLHNWEGIVNVSMEALAMDLESGKFLCKGKWFNSYEAENYLQNFKEPSDHPVCHSLTGYASGWCSAFSDIETVAIETKCIGMGHDYCSWEIRDLASWNGEADRWNSYLKNDSESISKKLEAAIGELNQLNENLEGTVLERTQKIQSQQQRLMESAKLGAIGEMAGGIAHEIKNPLAIIAGHSRMIRRKIEKGQFTEMEALEHLDKIDATVDRTNKIVNGLKNLSRDASKDAFQKIKISDLLEDILGITREKFKANGINIKVNHSQKGLNIFGNRVQLGQVLLNLLNNSFDEIAMNESAWVHIDVSLKDHSVIIKVVDSGTKLVEKASPKIFEPFYSSKEIGKGTGLGLSISKRILEDHKGSIHLDLNSKHTCFVIELMLHKD